MARPLDQPRLQHAPGSYPPQHVIELRVVETAVSRFHHDRLAGGGRHFIDSLAALGPLETPDVLPMTKDGQPVRLVPRVTRDDAND